MVRWQAGQKLCKLLLVFIASRRELRQCMHIDVGVPVAEVMYLACAWNPQLFCYGMLRLTVE